MLVLEQINGTKLKARTGGYGERERTKRTMSERKGAKRI